jgi:hypothetical protein
MDLVVRQAKTNSEVAEAIELICRSFPAIEYSDAKIQKEKLKNFLPEDFDSGKFIVAVNEGKVVGAFRLSERQLNIGGEKVTVLATTDYCVDKEATEENILGFDFYVKGCEIIKKWPYPLVMGSARRALANYYDWFGQTSCSIYSECHIEKLKLPKRDFGKVAVRKQFSKKNIRKYEKFHQFSFSKDWGFFERKTGFWEWIGYQADIGRSDFYEMWMDDELCGYFIRMNCALVDYGISSSHFGLCVSAMMESLDNLTAEEGVVLKLSPRNMLFGHLGLSHIGFRSRFVPDEGILSMCLDRERLVSLFCKIVARFAEDRIFEKAGFSLTPSLRFVPSGRRGVLPDFNLSDMTKKNEQTILNSIFLGINNRFSLTRDIPFRIIPETQFSLCDVECI